MNSATPSFRPNEVRAGIHNHDFLDVARFCVPILVSWLWIPGSRLRASQTRVDALLAAPPESQSSQRSAARSSGCGYTRRPVFRSFRRRKWSAGRRQGFARPLGVSLAIGKPARRGRGRRGHRRLIRLSRRGCESRPEARAPRVAGLRSPRPRRCASRRSIASRMWRPAPRPLGSRHDSDPSKSTNERIIPALYIPVKRLCTSISQRCFVWSENNAHQVEIVDYH